MENVIRMTRFNDYILVSEPWPICFSTRQKYAEFDKASGKILLQERQGFGRPLIESYYEWTEILDVRLGERLDTSEGSPIWVYAVQVVVRSGKRIILSDSYDRTEVMELVTKAQQFLLNESHSIESEPQAMECY